MKLIGPGSKHNLPYDVYWQDNLYNCPALPLFLKMYGELMDQDHAARNITWKNRNSMVWAQRDSTVLGGICYEYYQEYQAGYAILVFTDPACRRQGIATVLWDWFERDIRRQGGNAITLNVHVTNENMSKFCDSLDIKPVYTGMSKRINTKEKK